MAARFPIITKVKSDGDTTESFVYLTVNTIEESKSNEARSKVIDQYCKKYLIQHVIKTNLCFSCANASPISCEKIADLSPNIISKYPFITDGFQVQDPYFDFFKTEAAYVDGSEYEKTVRANNLRIVRFSVSGCKNYRAMRKRPESVK